MQPIRKLICILLGALMLMSALSGCAREEKPESERFVLRASVCGRIGSLDPAMNTDACAESVFYALYENLMRLDDDGEGGTAVAPGIAKEYRESANGNGTVDYVFTLRSSARWSDGSHVKARDFVYAWRRLVDPETGSPNHALLSMVQGYDEVRATGDVTKLAVKAEGDTTFRVTLSAPCSYFLSEVCTAVPTMPLQSASVNKSADWSQMTSLLCDGAYQVSVWVREEYIQLRRNSSYYENRASGPDVLRFVFSAGAEDALRLYEEGKVDFAAGVPGQAEPTGELPLRSTTYVLYNHMSEVFSNVHVRRAFDLALDRAAAAEAAGGVMTPADALVPPGIIDASTEADFRATGGSLCQTDAEGYAMRCLDAEGELRTGGYWGGIGFPTVNCLYVAGDEARAVAASVAATWHEKLSVAVTTEGVSREEFDRRVSAGEYDIAIGTLSVRCGDALAYLQPFAGMDGNNELHYVSKPFDLLIGVAAGSHDPAARAAFLHDAEALLLEDTALSPVCFGARGYLLREGLSGVRSNVRGNVFFGAVTRAETETPAR